MDEYKVKHTLQHFSINCQNKRTVINIELNNIHSRMHYDDIAVKLFVFVVFEIFSY